MNKENEREINKHVFIERNKNKQINQIRKNTTMEKKRTEAI